MIGSTRLSRLAYALSVAFLISASIAFAQFQDQLGIQSYARDVRMGVSATYVIISSARLADAGFRYWRSFILLTIILVALPVIGFFAYTYFIGLPKDPAEHADFLMIAAGLTNIVLWGAISLFCLAFPTAGAGGDSGLGPAAADDILDWKPSGHIPPQQKREPRF
ncbi:hypothetical protein V5F40_08245 [Xanthobacter sp. DSM 14520]|uniref:hypothetical protein n=1 Tax=Xanthobacter autotrophicus (strain ATCC BAA-1158 / Py2) TaxID=78245 RepID=UPI0037271884